MTSDTPSGAGVGAPIEGVSSEQRLPPDRSLPIWAALLLVSVNIVLAIGLGFALQEGWIGTLEGSAGTLGFFLLYVTPYALTLLLAWAIIARLGWRFGEAFGLRAFDATEGVALALAVAIAGRILATGWAVAVSLAGVTPPEELDVTALLPSSALGITLLVVLVVIIGPIAEEIVFRGALYPALRAVTGTRWAMVLSGALFGLIHIDLLWLVVPTALLGVALAWLYESTRSLWVPILCHAVFNLTALALAFLVKALGLV